MAITRMTSEQIAAGGRVDRARLEATTDERTSDGR